ncbi:MAG: DUF3368 domain-containing protein [Nitrospirales bacterium]|nr:DUF3368 domain-containing protein [Nitrospirales bacterium]
MKVVSNTGPIIALAKANLLPLLKTLFCDSAGRRAAGRLDIPVTGVVGILLLAKEKGLIHNVSEPIVEIRNNGYWLSQKVIEVAKQLAGE